MKNWIIISLVLSFINLSSQENTHTFNILEQLNLSPEQCKIELITSREFPNGSEETIYVIPEIVQEEADFFELNSHILIVDSKTGKIKHKFYESAETNGWLSDAIRLSEISIDTAPYYIRDNIRAFGIRVNYYGSSKPNPYSRQSISLFIKNGHSLKQVLKSYTIANYGGEWDMNCDSEFTEEKKLLILTKMIALK